MSCRTCLRYCARLGERLSFANLGQNIMRVAKILRNEKGFRVEAARKVPGSPRSLSLFVMCMSGKRWC